MKGISRIDSPKCHGWFARAYRNQKTYSKLFSDLKYGGKTKARQLAIRYLHKLEASLPPPERIPGQTPPFVLKGTLSGSNSTGVNGVASLYGRKNRRKVIIGYSANFHSNGKQNNRRFSLSKYGSKRKAFQAAVAFRRKMEREMLKEWKERVKLRPTNKHK
jgi:hypothetical protein